MKKPLHDSANVTGVSPKLRSLAAVKLLGLTVLLTCGLFAVAAPADQMTYSNTSGSQQSNVPVQFARVFMRGEITNFPQVLVDNTAVPTQANVREPMVRWFGQARDPLFHPRRNARREARRRSPFKISQTAIAGANPHLSRSAMLAPNFDFDAGVTLRTTAPSGPRAS